MKKLLKSLCVGSIFVALSFSNVYAAQNINLKIDGVLQNLESESIIVDNNLLVDVKKLAETLGATVTYSNFGNTVTLDKKVKSITMTVNSNNVIINGSALSSTVAPKSENKIIYVPARFVCQSLGADVSWIEKSRTIVVSTGKTELNILNLGDRITTKTRILSYKQGLETVFNNNSSINNLEDSKDLIDDQIKKAKDAEDTARYALNKAGEIQGKRTVKKLELQEDSIDDNIQQLKDSLEVTYRTYLQNIISAELDSKVLDGKIELEKINLKNLTVKNQLGMESDFTVSQEKETIKQYESQKKSTELSIKNAREALNLFLQYSRDTDLYIDYNLQYRPVDDAVDRHIAIEQENDPQITIENRDIDYAQFVLDTTDNSLNESTAQLENDLLTQQRKHTDTINSFATNIYKTFNSLKQLEEKRKSLEVSLQVTKNNYNKAITNFEAGVITIFDAQQIKVQLLNNEADLFKNQLDYDNLKFKYDKPYLLK